MSREVLGPPGLGPVGPRIPASRLAPGPQAARRPLVDVEFAHHCAVPCDEALTEREIHASAQVARGLVECLRGAGADVMTSILVDDKKNVSDDIDTRRHAAVELCVDSLRADRVMLESELVHLLDDLAAALPDSALLDGFFARLRRRGELACSQDVTIWHALRLGLFDPAGWHWVCPASPSEDSARSGDVCVAILPRRLQRFEEKAYTENLATLLGPTTLEHGRMTLRGHFSGRAVALVAVWVDVATDDALDPADLYELGAAEGHRIAQLCRSTTVLDTIG